MNIVPISNLLFISSRNFLKFQEEERKKRLDKIRKENEQYGRVKKIRKFT